MFKKTAQAVLARSRLESASASAVAKSNTPGQLLDVEGSSPAAAAAAAIQGAIQGEETGKGSVIIHKPEVFARIRHRFGRSEGNFNKSLCESDLRVVGQEQAAGKSQAFFVFTEDGRYCMKAVEAAEAVQLLRIVEDYEKYVGEHVDTLLPKFYALYEVQLTSYSSPLWMMVMGNVLGGRQSIHQRFDIKGSTHGRQASAKELAKGKGSVLKDLDFVLGGCSVAGRTVDDEAAWDTCATAIVRDAAWLASQNLIDYSLLLGFAICSTEDLKAPLSHVVRLQMKPDCLGKKSPPVSRAETLVLYVGIVDCLMPYGWFKRFENIICDALLSGDISCQPPDRYAARFSGFVRKLGLPPGELEEFTADRIRKSRRPLGAVVGEFGRKDVISWATSPTTIIISAGLAALLLSWTRARA